MKYRDAPRPSVQYYEVPPDNWMSILDMIDSLKECAIIKSNRPQDKERPYEVWIEGNHWNSCRTFQEAQQSINEGETAWREGRL